MPFKTLLVHVEATAESDLRLRTAVELASNWGAALLGVGGCKPAYLDNPMLLSGYDDGTLVQAIADMETEDLAKSAERFAAASAGLGDAAQFLSVRNYPDRVLAACSAGADIIIASAHRGPRASTAAAADLVLRSGLPVLTVQADRPPVSTRHVVVAWKNTREARRAVSDAIPLLAAAERVTILRIHPTPDPETGARSEEAVAARLARHGVNAIPETLEASEGHAHAALTSFAVKEQAGLIVAGAYGHTRLGEWALGGMTDSLLSSAPVPVLFSH
ncbi:MAG: universal stress protein [Caulobacteraceae bacterium]